MPDRVEAGASQRRGLLVLVALAVLLRAGFLLWYAEQPGFDWDDPDHYRDASQRLNPTGSDWSWSDDAASWFGVLRAPLYPGFLSLFEPWQPWSPALAASAQIALDGLAVIGVWGLAGALAGHRAAWIAAAGQAVWFPDLARGPWLRQEQLYVPLLVLSLALLARLAERDARPRRFAAAGLLMGLAALTRSMPLYYAPPAALWLATTGAEAKRSRRQAGAWLLGFLLLPLAWSLPLSQRHGRLVVVEETGLHNLRQTYAEASAVDEGVLSILVRAATTDPGAFATGVSGRLAGTLRLDGGRWLHAHGRARDEGGARRLELAVHLLGDLPLAIALLLAPLGWAVARGRRAAGLCALWLAVHLPLTALAGFSGARFRLPADAALIALAAATVSGFRAPRRRLLAAAGMTAVTAVTALAWLPATIETLQLRARFGAGRWLPVEGALITNLEGDAGFHAPGVDGRVILDLWRGLDADPEQTLSAEVRVDGQRAALLRLEPAAAAQRVVHPWPHARPAWVELRCFSCPGGRRRFSLAVWTAAPP